MKFYKIVNPEGHNGLVYQEGINVDPIPFRPWGSCVDGGIYFSREDILAFLSYGTELYEVEPIGEIYEDPQNYPQKWKAHSVKLTYIGKVKNNIKMLVKQGADIHVDNDYALRWAAEHGYLKVVKYLVKQGLDVCTCNDYSLRYAFGNGHLETAKYLVEHGADIHIWEDYPLCWAAENGHLEVVKTLVKEGADIHIREDYPLRWAAENGHLEVVKYLKSKM